MQIKWCKNISLCILLKKKFFWTEKKYLICDFMNIFYLNIKKVIKKLYWNNQIKIILKMSMLKKYN